MNFANPLMIVGLAAMPLAARQAVDSKPAAPATKQDSKQDSPSALVQKLGDKDYKARKEAFRALEKMGPQARGELEKALKSDDAEVRWSASLLLDRLDDQEESSGTTGRLRARKGEQEPRDPAATDDDDPSDPFAPGLRGFRPLNTPDDAMQEMKEAIRRLEDFQKQLESQNSGWFHGSPFGLRMQDDPFRGFGFGQGGKLELGPGSSFSRTMDDNGQRESLSIRVDKGGHVTAELEKNGEKTTYQADSLDALQKEHPELLEGTGGMRIRTMPFSRAGNGRGQPNDPLEIQPAPRARNKAGDASQGGRKGNLEKPGETKDDGAQVELAPERPKLGVHVQPVSADVAKYLELEEGLGLEVIDVQPGSAAEKIGVKARDIITEINGQEIRGVADVAKALGSKEPADAEVTVLRRGAEKTLDPHK